MTTQQRYAQPLSSTAVAQHRYAHRRPAAATAATAATVAIAAIIATHVVAAMQHIGVLGLWAVTEFLAALLVGV